MAIYEKLLKFQKLNITIERDGENPHFKSSFTTLNEVLGKVKKPLNDLGILIVQSPSISGMGDTPVLTTKLIDTEDSSLVESHVALVGTSDMQKMGGAITYAKRYALIAMLGLEDEDDDGEKASYKPKAAQGNARENAPF